MDWIAKRIAEAQTAAPVEVEVVSCLEGELGATLRERALTKAELADLAKQLIAAAEPPDPAHED
ncbi:MAG TPA: hypothetical protein VMF32_25950 [Xanthobacteraceae bacterium]|nr:hypothetical protein [Xanthobacteraceae bacterium]